MALIWQKQNHATDYRVVRAGASIRLYRNGVLHSQWNPRQPVKGNLWELFLLSSLGNEGTLKRVLVLGLGGGAVVKLIHSFFPGAVIDAIELDQTHIRIAKKYFRVNAKNCNLIHSNAIDWMKTFTTKPYDLIIDDVFHEAGQVPFRSIQTNADWIKRLLRRLDKSGTLVINFADKEEWNTCRTQPKVQRLLENYEVGVARHKNCQNRIVHIAARPLSATVIRKSLRSAGAHAYLRNWSAQTFSYRRVQ